ncbi:homocysteine S-methyltransferase [Streptomyces lividans]|uniref:Homocysteine S-methyltransferase n=2 Tax=Streptomyces lividans TaxID=1916 RepID=A0A7U9HE70_STRLI|nr:homocysteine S-methyltransferase [Streptomyces lividans]AIJ12505.1 homocysteine methyltransferase [Streptomyces lividans TK24]EFD65851.1 homocysteine methyltransferase [Streptomyces lividans TK24]EOY51235.1 Homocysteine S-methyltransferase [Streptomyces lividans 1326]QSJ08013.1 homocysteine methyltransferase [Streptomyces lividans]QTD68937.1 homocysteine methyltransferase [Streptomyces lividans TK24] [Streptomyces lividans]
MTSDFADALASGPLVLDGGLSNQLEAAGHDLGDALWSARLLAEDPEAITRAHLAYFEAGAEVAITSSYQATFEGFARRGIGRERAAELLALSVASAREAARRARTARPERALWVAASAGPYGAMLADGSEYRGRYGLGRGALERFHRPRLEVLAAARPDVLALETVPDTDEAAALLRAVRGLDVPAWLSYTVAGDRTRAGQPLDEAFALAADADEVIAVGVNCCAPEDVSGAVETAARVTGKPVVAYPNSGETWDARSRGWRGRSSYTAERVRDWWERGARLVGGCCRVGPETITSIARALPRE